VSRRMTLVALGLAAAGVATVVGGQAVHGRGNAAAAARTADPHAALAAVVDVVARVAPVATAAGATAARRQPDWPFMEYNGTFVLTRVRFGEGRDFGGFGWRRQPMWYHDHPDAEYNFARILEAITYVRPTLNASNIVGLEQDRIFQFPMLYMVEPGYWRPTELEIARLREYLLKGGMIVFDDFDDRQLYVLAQILQRVLPELNLVPLDGSEAVFDSFFHIDIDTLRFPGFYRGDRIDFWGIFEDNDRAKRLLVIAGNNGDLGDFWEYSDTGFYPVDLTNDAYKVGINYVVYAMTH
jgi:hypothetical protein